MRCAIFLIGLLAASLLIPLTKAEIPIPSTPVPVTINLQSENGPHYDIDSGLLSCTVSPGSIICNINILCALPPGGSDLLWTAPNRLGAGVGVPSSGGQYPYSPYVGVWVVC